MKLISRACSGVGLAALLFLAGVPARAAGVALPEARFRAQLLDHDTRYLFEPGSIGVDEDVLSGSGRPLGHVSGSAATSDGLLPTAAIQLELSGNGTAARSEIAHAALTYYWRVEQIAGPPRSTARVRISAAGSVSSALVGDADASPLYAMAIIDFIGSQSTFVAGVNPGHPFTGNAFDSTFTKFVGKESIFSTSLVAYGLAAVGWEDGAGTARLDAFVDPLIEIDPEWSFARDFRVVFSSGIGIAPIPEPASVLLLVAGLVTLCARMRHRGSMLAAVLRHRA
jgi:hypothetical protein